MPKGPTPHQAGTADTADDRGTSRSGAPPGASRPIRPARRGRPPGSVALTEDIAQRIITYIRAGGYDYVAAEAAGVSARTLRDWIGRGEGTHPTRGPTPKLRRFAEQVRTARAEARISAEVSVHRQHPLQWLSRVARSKPDREGWTDPGPDQDEREPTLEERLLEIERGDAETGALIDTLESAPTLIERVAARDLRLAREGLPPASSRCPDPNCPCTNHKRKELP
jgi:hypothetical protein